jgi:hypothetical protein
LAHILRKAMSLAELCAAWLTAIAPEVAAAIAVHTV